jgi:hypothetical protein
MTVQGMQHMVQENLRSVMGLLKRRDEGLPEVVYDRDQMLPVATPRCSTCDA